MKMNENIFYNILIGLAFFGILFNLLFGFAKIHGESMSPTFQDGQFKLYTKVVGEKLHNQDVIIFETRDKYNKSTLFIKRVIAQEGTTLKFDQNKIIKDGQVVGFFLDDGHIYKDTDEITLQKGEVFVLGDNFTDSLDSRYLGPIQKDQIKGILVSPSENTILKDQGDDLHAKIPISQ